MRRQFIKARMKDNPSLLEADPDYDDKLSGLGSPALVRAMRDGDWNVVEGAFFPEWEEARHVLRPVELPLFWTRFRSGDWGSAKPYSFRWWAVASDDWQHPDGVVVPRGALLAYRELYGIRIKPDGGFDPDVGVKETAGEVARKILTLEGAAFDDQGEMTIKPSEKIEYGVIDPAAWASDSGPSIGERMAKAGVWLAKADNKRISQHGAVGGHDQFRARLKGDGDGRPMIYWFSTNVHAIRTIPALQHDPIRAEDVNTHMEDHCYDDSRYACMSRPYKAKPPKQPATSSLKRPQTMADLERHVDRDLEHV